MIMKKSILSTLILICAFSSSIYSQEYERTKPRYNFLAGDEYGGIKYNGFTIDQLNETHGEDAKIVKLWGGFSSVERDTILGSNTFYYGENYVHFYDNEVTRMEIHERDWPLVVKDIEIKVGDSFGKIRRQFGGKLVPLYPIRRGNSYSVVLNSPGNGYDSLSLNFSGSHKLSKITYYVIP